jgi:hypothetical protein
MNLGIADGAAPYGAANYIPLFEGYKAMVPYGDRWGPLGTVGDRWGPLGTVGDRWGPLGTVGDRWDFNPIQSLASKLIKRL